MLNNELKILKVACFTCTVNSYKQIGRSKAKLANQKRKMGNRKKILFWKYLEKCISTLEIWIFFPRMSVCEREKLFLCRFVSECLEKFFTGYCVLNTAQLNGTQPVSIKFSVPKRLFAQNFTLILSSMQSWSWKFVDNFISITTT